MKYSGILFILILFLVACAPATPDQPFKDLPEVPGQVVTFTTADNVKLYATRFGEGSTAVILAHMGLYSVTQKSWQPFAQYAAGQGFTALTLDFRGNGLSAGGLEQSKLVYDINAAVDYLRSQGYEKIVCIGASMGGTACMRSAIDNNLDGLVMVASPFSIGTPTYTSPSELENIAFPTLYISAVDDPFNVVIDLKVMYAKSPDPTQLVLYEGVSEHGTDLFKTKYGIEFRDLLISFLNDLT